jgi:hypothetical protein
MSSAALSCSPAALAAADPALKAAVPGEALPYLRRYAGQVHVISKCQRHPRVIPGSSPGRGPGQATAPRSPWIPAFAGMTGKR